MDNKKKKKIMKQVKEDRSARRKLQYELQIPQETSKIHKTSKKDSLEKESNTVKEWNNE